MSFPSRTSLKRPARQRQSAFWAGYFLGALVLDPKIPDWLRLVGAVICAAHIAAALLNWHKDTAASVLLDPMTAVQMRLVEKEPQVVLPSNDGDDAG